MEARPFFFFASPVCNAFPNDDSEAECVEEASEMVEARGRRCFEKEEESKSPAFPLDVSIALPLIVNPISSEEVNFDASNPVVLVAAVLPLLESKWTRDLREDE